MTYYVSSGTFEPYTLTYSLQKDASWWQDVCMFRSQQQWRARGTA